MVDWNGRLECNRGEITSLSGTNSENCRRVSVGHDQEAVFYWVCDDGEPCDADMGDDKWTVYNVKSNRDKAIEALYRTPTSNETEDGCRLLVGDLQELGLISE